ncbi:EAL domain-containing protein [Massilia yuzhufengensis]|uniref:PAS domain S-box-containing protein/diguanylate cyclase (GGDEF) domain-containing protein n=1 Tax=Massilia yuzhufengensis TaxID=1164594 RepID=A0A1I1URH6_9BURK|nr:EAL domain-containing protein [Massilia yuzhufengensis]SFD73387.1 PAS domain S-box-containing protein/diguanylate cyclase (GGDEF) domain-containing protein [Massilia yuzhufengensis]
MISLSDIRHARILVVDDEPVNVQLLEYLLKTTGYENVASTNDPRQVVSMHLKQRYDLIILDLHMPGMDGFDVMEALKPLESDSWLPVLVVTAEPDKKLAALEAGARDFIGKPFDTVEVMTRIRNLLEVRLLHRESQDYGVALEREVRERTAELARFRGAMDATPDAIFLIDTASMAMVDVSDGACRMLGFSRDALLRIDPVALGLGTRELLERHLAADAVASGPQAEKVEYGALPGDIVETELLRAGGQGAVAVEISWKLKDLGKSRMLIAVARDISERLHAQERMRHMASYDALTGLPNRTLFFQNLRDAIELARDKNWRVAVLCITLDRFKIINDSLGTALGDELLRQFSTRLVRCVRLRDTVGRLGGDEFALILTMTRDQQEAVNVANEIREALRAPFDLHGQAAALTASIGIAMYPEDSTEPGALIKYADTAMVRAKEAGRDGYRFFTAGMNVQVLARLDLELALRGALEGGEFVLYYQPKLELNTGRVAGVEALLRWNRPGFGLVYPAEFVPVMEETGLVVRVGEWIVHEACRQIAAWNAAGLRDVRVAVNVSSRQFVEDDLEGVIRAALERHGVEPGMLELELTESALMSNAEHTIEVLGRLKELGIRIAIDDFGTGYSSLAYLKRFPIDKLKIDIAFVRDIVTNPDDAAIALAIISMAHSLHMQVIAEGVETRAQMAYLRRHRCDEIQGFHFSRGIPADDLARLVRDNRAQPDQPPAQDDKVQTLLIVDDDVNVLTSLHRLFRRDNYRVLTASSPAEGFELLALYRVQVIVCDQRMPVMSGTEFLSKVKEMYPGTIRIILSGYTGVETVLDSINRGAIYRFYTKPWHDQQLRENIRLAFRHYWMTNGPYDDRKAPREGDEKVA